MNGINNFIIMKENSEKKCKLYHFKILKIVLNINSFVKTKVICEPSNKMLIFEELDFEELQVGFI